MTHQEALDKLDILIEFFQEFNKMLDQMEERILEKREIGNLSNR